MCTEVMGTDDAGGSGVSGDGSMNMGMWGLAWDDAWCGNTIVRCWGDECDDCVVC